MKTLLRFITCGSVDDGKSTLIGRLLYECGAVFDDQLTTLNNDSKKYGTDGDNLDYALLVDGLAAEREQGITIDVAYRYFSTPKRSFIVADTPGHEQYTRNMATGASTAELAILLIDARKGLLPQTKRHSNIVSMMGVKHVILAVNKMDMVGYDEAIFNTIKADYLAFAGDLGFKTIEAIPLSARQGDNIVVQSTHMPWFKGQPLLPVLEAIEVEETIPQPFRFPVQYVNRPDVHFRGYAGTIASGKVNVGDKVTLYPSLKTNVIAKINGDKTSAQKGEAVTLEMQNETDISRGDVLGAVQAVKVSSIVKAKLLWTSQKPSSPLRVLVKLGTMEVFGNIIEQSAPFNLNDIGIATVKLEKPISFTNYSDTKELGSFLIIDPFSYETLGLGFIDDGIGAANRSWLANIWHKFKTGSTSNGETHQRSLVKAITWRVTGSLDTFLLSYLFTSSAKLAAAISATEVVTKIFLYYGHERLWSRVTFGLNKPEEENKDGAGI